MLHLDFERALALPQSKRRTATMSASSAAAVRNASRGRSSLGSTPCREREESHQWGLPRHQLQTPAALLGGVLLPVQPEVPIGRHTAPLGLCHREDSAHAGKAFKAG